MENPSDIEKFHRSVSRWLTLLTAIFAAQAGFDFLSGILFVFYAVSAIAHLFS